MSGSTDYYSQTFGSQGGPGGAEEERFATRGNEIARELGLAPLPAFGPGAPNRPTGEARTARGPVADTLGMPIRDLPGEMPGVGAQAVGSLPRDPEARLRVFAQSMFPDMPEDQARKRFGFDRGRLFYVGRDGKPYYADPQWSTRLAEIPRAVASSVGPAIPAAGGIAGGVVGGPGPQSIATAAAGGAAGEALRQGLAEALVPGGAGGMDWYSIAGEGLLAGAGQGAGLGVARRVTRNPVGVAPYDRRSAQNVARSGAADAARTEAQRQNVPLTLGQASNIRSVRELERALATAPRTADTLDNFYRAQRVALADAAERYATSLSPGAGSDAAARTFAAGAGEVAPTVRRAANVVARPHYAAAEATDVPLTPAMRDLLARPAIRDAWGRAQTMAANEGRELPQVFQLDDAGNITGVARAPDFRAWDYMKRALDDAVNAADMAGERSQATVLRDLRSTLRAEVDAAVPAYPQARAAAQPGHTLAERLESGALGRTVNQADDLPARTVTAPLFDYRRVSPTAIAETREAFLSAGQGDAWNAGLKAWFLSHLDEASRGIEGGASAARLRQNLWSDPRAREAMRAAMSPEQFQGFDSLMRVVEYAARTLPDGSPTANKLMAGETVERLAQTPGVRLWNAVGSVFSPMRLADTAGRMTDRVAWNLTERAKERLANALIDPAAVDQLARLRMLSPTSNAAIDITAQILTRAGVAGAENVGAEMIGIEPPSRLPGVPVEP